MTQNEEKQIIIDRMEKVFGWKDDEVGYPPALTVYMNAHEAGLVIQALKREIKRANRRAEKRLSRQS